MLLKTCPSKQVNENTGDRKYIIFESKEVSGGYVEMS
jgi:hypothetical protein